MFHISPMIDTPANLPRLAEGVRKLCAAVGLITVATALAVLALALR